MNNYDNHKSMLRYAFVSAAMVLLAVAVIGKAGFIATVKKPYWDSVQAKVKRDSVIIPATRGNILSDGGQQLSCNLPEYRIYMDFVALQESKADTLWHDSVGNMTKEFNNIVKGLHQIFPSRSEADFREDLLRGYENRERHFPIWKHRIDYTTYNKVKALPIFCLRSNKGGFHEEKFMIRNRPYGQMAASIVGSTYKEKGVPYSGLELAYDTTLSGTPGIIHRRKVLNSWISISDMSPVKGGDLVSTINVGIQDLAERALIKELKKDNAYTGVAIVMEVKTGDIKAMVSLDRDEDGEGYHESERNHAISDWLEPGSVFKTASIMVAIEDGYITDTARTVVDTGCGIMEMHGSKMRDHNWSHGGYGVINVPKILQVSSNIGVSYLIDKYYGSQPDKFVKGIHRTGLATNLNLPFPNYISPRIRIPHKDKRGKYTQSEWVDKNGNKHTSGWSNTALPWMSIGYETNVPPISTLTFYNAIANGGRMVKPRFVTRIEKDGQVVKEFPVEVIKEHICSDKTLGLMQDMLEKVVSVGLGKKAGSKAFRVAGKTGTAQKAHNGSYKSGITDYLLSFAGFFPYDDPKYSCIVCIQKSGLPASGGGMSGAVFHDIAEGIYAQNIKYDVTSAKDSSTVVIPGVKNGNILAADFVLTHLGLPIDGGWNGSYSDGNPIWGNVTTKTNEVKLAKASVVPNGYMPDVHGMGARDAVFLLEKRGVKVIVNGRGKVIRQSKEVGKKLNRGEKIQLDLG